MKKRLFSLYMKEVFAGYKFYASTAAIILIFIGTAYMQIGFGETLGDVGWLIHLITMSSYTKAVAYILPCMPLILSFCDDCTNQYIRSIVIRSGVRKYTAAKFIAGGISAFASLFISFLSVVIIISVRFNVPLPQPGMYWGAQNYVYFAEHGMPAVTILIRVFQFALYGTMFACIALAVGAVIQNKFIVLAAPFVASFVFEEVPFSLHLPSYFDMLALTNGAQPFHVDQGETETLGFILKNILFNLGLAFGFILIAYIVFDILVKRRINCKIGNI